MLLMILLVLCQNKKIAIISTELQGPEKSLGHPILAITNLAYSFFNYISTRNNLEGARKA